MLYLKYFRSEANDLALQLAKEFTGNQDIIVFESSFHGCLGTVSAISPKTYNNDLHPKDWVTIIHVPDLFRGQFRSSDPEALDKYFQQTKDIIQSKLNENRKVCTFLQLLKWLLASGILDSFWGFPCGCSYIKILHTIEGCFNTFNQHLKNTVLNS